MSEHKKTLENKLQELQQQDDPFILVGNNKDFFLLKFNQGNITKNFLNISYQSGIKFGFDEKLGLYLPQTENPTKKRFKKENDIEIINDQIQIHEILNEIGLKNYFEQNIVPYLSNETTKFKTPKLNFNLFQRIFNPRGYNKPIFTGQYDLTKGYEILSKATKDFKENEPVYIGSKRQVFVFNLSKDEHGLIMNQSYPKTEDLLYFANNFLDYVNINKRSEPIIVHSIDREQNCRNNLFYGEPEIITNDISKALKHFKKSDFAYLRDILEKHYEIIKK